MKEPELYHSGRLGKSIQLTYRLRRRTDEVIGALRQYPLLNRILDIGTADGLMLSRIKSEFPDKQCIGIDISHELLKTNEDKDIHLLQADTLNTPFKDQGFDIIVAAALVEHLSRPLDLVKESHRLLRRDGLFILTTPDPFWIRLAADCRIFRDEEHRSFINLNSLKDIIQKNGFEIIKSEKFMISPAGFPFELKIERFIKKIKFDFLLLNQLIVGRKKC